MINKVILNLILFSAFGNAAADDPRWQPHSEVISAVEKYVSENLVRDDAIRSEINSQYLDNRLRLIRCETPLQAFGDNVDFASTRFTIGVRCDGARPWKVYVPVQISRYARVAVAAQSLKADQPLREDQLIFVERRLDEVNRGYIFTPEQAQGQIVKQTIYAGTPVYVSALKSMPLVKRGEHVTIMAQTHGISVKMAGSALSDASRGQTVKVKNLSSARTIEARVVDYSLVEVIF